jgi:hypothetical protein
MAQATPNEDLISLQTQHSLEYQHRMTVRPLPTRAGHLRFVGAKLADPMWAPLYIERYIHGEEPDETRRALLDLIYRSTHILPEEIIERFSQEPDRIRAEIVDMMESNAISFERLERDESPLVRAALVRRVAKDSEAPTEIIVRALHDKDVQVLSDAARAAHRRQCEESIPRLAELILHQDGTVALRALYALSKLKPTLARTLIQKHQLTESTHIHLSLFAQRLAE